MRKNGGAQPIQGLFMAILLSQARDGMRRPLEPTGARPNLGHDLLDALHRLVFHQPRTISNHNGESQSLLMLSPTVLRSRVREPSLQSQCNVSPSSVNKKASGTRERPWSPRLGSGDPIRALVRGKTLKALQKTRVWRLVAGGLWTRAGFEAAGYDINPMCPLCEQDLDTPFHRVWECQPLGVAEARVARKKKKCFASVVV